MTKIEGGRMKALAMAHVRRVALVSLVLGGMLLSVPASALAASTSRAGAWGANPYGQLGDGTKADRPLPAAVHMPPGVTFTAVSAGGYHSLAVAADGTGWAWGDNPYGELGDNSTTNRVEPVTVQMPVG